ncbi:Uu.00g145590.m01.CDS01 [Anthostomella pinea]|uniref:Uu.00g145590.m01.CDS01 n=1 Tax=Anthostomella pinea TaxID=933095 RepID=A0AAI8VR40_9PEZI|nr:Uu.00g145590.m01.CDS01 [Anthostomella pinea]
MSSALVAESWTWYSLTWTVVLARMTSRRALFGSFKKLQIDDALMFGAMATDTVLMVAINIISHTSSNLIDPNDHAALTKENIAERAFGSKMVVVAEQMQILTIWLVKACLLLMYARLTMSLKQNISVKIVAVYVTLGFVVMEILYLGVWCRPFSQYWAVPPDNVQCSAATNHLITNAVLNISSDFMIILIPMPVFLQSQLPGKRKAILCCVFALGLFTILSAILNKFYSFHEPFGTAWTFWYIRESSTALITANLPFTWTLLQRVFNLKSFNGKSSNQRTGDPPSGFRSGYGNHNTTVGRGEDMEFSRTDSQEHINRTFERDVPLKIYKQQEVHVTRTDGDQESSRSSATSIETKQ